MTLRNSLGLLMFTLALSALPARSRADDSDAYGEPTSPAAQKELDQGNRLYRVREFERAIDFYKSGATIEDAPVFFFNLAQCHRQLGDYEKAIWYFERWISKKQPPHDHPLRVQVEELIAQMRSELEQKGRSQEPLDPGPSAEPADNIATPASITASKPTTRSSEPPRWYHDGVGWTGAGIGAATAVGGVTLLVGASILHSDADAEPVASEREAIRRRADTRQTWGTALTVAGGVVAAAGVVKLWLHEPGESRVEVVVGPGSLGIQGSF